MKKSDTLRLNGIRHLQSYFRSEKDKDLIKNKFNNISAKTGQYHVPDTLFQKRTPRKNRVLIPFEHVKKSNLTYEQLDTFEGGVAVEFINNDFFEELSLPSKDRHPIFNALENKLGSDDNVSAVIVIRGTGDSSSAIQREALDNLVDYLDSRNILLKDALLRRKENVIYKGQGNNIWEGFVYYSIRGGQQDVLDSHIQHKIDSRNVQLFNPAVEYAGHQVSNDITMVLIYFALFSVEINSRGSDWKKIKNDYLSYFDTRIYKGKSLKTYVNNHISLNLIENMLTDPIQVEPIVIQDFAISGREDNAVDITHQVSVNKTEYYWDSYQNSVISPANPTNLFWSKHLSNMMQQNFSLKEYFIHQREILDKWDSFGIDNLE